MIAQALIEKGMLDGLAVEAGLLIDRFWASVEDGSVIWLLLIVALFVLFKVSRKPG